MEEVDKIIVLTLRQIGTELPESVTSLKGVSHVLKFGIDIFTDLQTESFVEGCARCINTINGNEEVPFVCARPCNENRSFLSNFLQLWLFGFDMEQPLLRPARFFVLMSNSSYGLVGIGI